MQIKKFFITATVSAALSLASFSTFADLYIDNNSNIQVFKVDCTGPMPGVPINKTDTAQLNWGLIQLILGGLKGSCSFYDNATNHLKATAAIQIQPTLAQARITNIAVYDPTLSVTVKPGINTYSANIRVTVS